MTRTEAQDPAPIATADVCNGTDALSEIRRLVASCRLPLLDRQIVGDDRGAVSRLIDDVTVPAGVPSPVWMDIPLSAVVGLQRVVGFKGATWRQSLDGLAAQDWDSRVFDYWSGEVRDKVFPAKMAKRALRLECRAGAVLVVNGAHRMAAGMAWLCATRGDDAVYKRARVSIHDQRGTLVDELVKLAHSSRRVDVARRAVPSAEHPEVHVNFVRATSPRGRIATYTVNVAAGRLDPDNVLHREVEACLPLDWKPLPGPLVAAWADRSWLHASLARAERCPTFVD